MSRATYVDTNVLVRVYDVHQPAKMAHAQAVLAEEQLSGAPTISSTVLGELYMSLVRPHRVDGERKPPLCGTHAQAEAIVLGFARAFEVVSVGRSDILEALRLRGRYQLGYWDAVHVAVARASSCTKLLTEDVGSAPTIEGVTYEDPFAELKPKRKR